MIDEVAEAAIEKTMSEAFFIEPAASLEGEGKPRPAANVMGIYCEPEPKVVEVKIEKSGRVTDASILEEHILEQYDTKGYAMVRAEYLDNGRKRFFRLPEEQDTA
ncbi:unnamed protein product [Urochloa humidicola]